MMESDPHTEQYENGLSSVTGRKLNATSGVVGGSLHHKYRQKRLSINKDTLKLNSIQQDVLKEYQLAVTKHPKWPTDPFRALAILSEEHGELAQAVIDTTYAPSSPHAGLDNVRREAQQLAAMCLRFVEHLDNYKFERGEQT